MLCPVLDIVYGTLEKLKGDDDYFPTEEDISSYKEKLAQIEIIKDEEF